MAVHTLENSEESRVLDGGMSANKGPINYGNSFGINPEHLSLMSETKGSEYTASIAKALKEAYTASGKSHLPKITVFDKETFPALSYSVIVTHMLIGKRVQYFTILLEATGRKPLTVDEVIGQYNAAIKIPGATPFIYTADDAFNEPLFKIITEYVSKEYPEGTKLHSVDGLVLTNSHPEISLIIRSLAFISYNALLVEGSIENGQQDFNIQNVLTNDLRGKQLVLRPVMSKGVQVNYVGSPVRSDWSLNLTVVDNKNNIPTLNMENSERILTSTRGYVDAIPVRTIINAVNGNPGIEVSRFRPNIVITSTRGIIPSVGYALLGLISSTVMIEKSMWLAALKPSDPKNHVGNLNIIAKTDEGVGDRLDLTNKKYSMDQVYQAILGMFTLAPIISMDCESFGTEASYTSIFSAAAQSTDGQTKSEALRRLCETASWLTSSRFPADFYVNNPVFANDGVMVPIGKWSSKNAERDLREIDLAFLASNIEDEQILQRWALSSLPMNITNIDPYMAKVEILSKLIPSAEITGKAVRVTFSSIFINTLISAATDAGLVASYKPEIQFVETTNLGIMSSYLDAAAINRLGGFARQTIQAGPNYSTSYSNMGYNRY